MTEIEQILSNYDFQRRNENVKINVEELENRINFKFPQEYKFYAINYIENETFVGNEFIRLWDVNDLLELNTEYGILNSLKNTIAIGSNGSSEFIAIEFLKNKEYRVVLSPFIDLDKKCHIEIGNSFADFFKRLENGENWFD